MAQHSGLLVEPADHLRGVVGNLLQGLLREDIGVSAGFLDRFGVVRPRWRHTRVAVVLEQTDPAVPAAWQQPEPMDEDDRRLAVRVGFIDLALLALCDPGQGAAPSLGGGHHRRRVDFGQYLTITARITHIGGPTVLLEVEGWRLLTDPTFDPPGGSYNFGWGTGSRKTAGPAIDASDVGPVDAVLLSHDQHDDNLDPAGRALLPAA